MRTPLWRCDAEEVSGESAIASVPTAPLVLGMDGASRGP